MSYLAENFNTAEVYIKELIPLFPEIKQVKIAQNINTKELYYNLESSNIKDVENLQKLLDKKVETIKVYLSPLIKEKIIDKHMYRYADAYMSTEVQDITIDELEPNMILREDIFDNDGKLFLKKWNTLTPNMISLIKHNCDGDNFIEVFIPNKNNEKENEIIESVKPKILLVDDQKFITDSLSMQLKDFEFNVEILNNPEHIIIKIRKVKPDIILLDINMPNLNGFQVLEEIKRFSYLKHIPIIMLTARGTKNDIFKAISLGAKDYIIKPPKLELIIEKLKTYLPKEKQPIELNKFETEQIKDEDLELSIEDTLRKLDLENL